MANMNKKRKILTVVALALFGVIIFFHYYGPWYDNGNVWHDRMSAAEKATAVNRGYKVTVIPRPKFDPDKFLAQKEEEKNLGFTPDKGLSDWQHDPVVGGANEPVKGDIFDRVAATTEEVTVERPGIGYCLTDMYPLIKDVRMPLFVLAVFYVGLFSILASHERTRTS
jgi:hypothetical protein